MVDLFCFLRKKENCAIHSKPSKEIRRVLGTLEGNSNSIEKGKIVMINRVTMLYLTNNREHGERPYFLGL